MKTIDLFNHSPVVPVVVIEDSANALDLAETLIASGIRSIEITLRTEAALPAIEKIASACPDICIGAGSIRRTSQIKSVLDAGARFCVSPGFSEAILAEAEACQANLVPGAATATEALQLFERGYDLIKFFPAELLGGLKMIKALSAPLPEIKFFPTGGITAELAVEYLAEECIKCVGGSWFVDPELIAAGKFDLIGEQASAALKGLKVLS